MAREEPVQTKTPQNVSEVLAFLKEHGRLDIDIEEGGMNYGHKESGSITVKLKVHNPDTERDETILEGSSYLP